MLEVQCDTFFSLILIHWALHAKNTTESVNKAINTLALLRHNRYRTLKGDEHCLWFGSECVDGKREEPHDNLRWKRYLILLKTALHVYLAYTEPNLSCKLTFNGQQQPLDIPSASCWWGSAGVKVIAWENSTLSNSRRDMQPWRLALWRDRVDAGPTA